MSASARFLAAVNQRYEDRRSNLDNAPAPPLPPELWELVREAAGHASAACGSIPPPQPGIALVNWYTHAGRLGLHQVHLLCISECNGNGPTASVLVWGAVPCRLGLPTGYVCGGVGLHGRYSTC